MQVGPGADAFGAARPVRNPGAGGRPGAPGLL